MPVGVPKCVERRAGAPCGTEADNTIHRKISKAYPEADIQPKAK